MWAGAPIFAIWALSLREFPGLICAFEGRGSMANPGVAVYGNTGSVDMGG